MPRKIWVSSVALRGGGRPTVRENTEAARHWLEAAGGLCPDIVCLPEAFATVGVPYCGVGEVAQPVPGPITDMAADIARHRAMYVICPVQELRDGRVYNSAVLLDRGGQIAGIYEKIHPVTSSADYTELEHGVTPGAEATVFETDFGRIGILICFDINWPAEWAELNRRGAEIVFWPSAYNGGFPLQAYAFRHGYYVVSSTWSISRVIDVTGHILAETGRLHPLVSAEIDLEKQVLHADFNALQVEALRARYGRAVRVDLYHDEALMTIESRQEGLGVAQIMAEMGLEPLSEYLERNERAQAALRAGRAPDPQLTPYVGRRMHEA
jgi:beta-ureidopropionase